MAEKKFFVDINLQGSALTNAKIGTNSGIGSTEGAFGYDSASHRLQYFNGSATQNVANLSDISAVTGGLIFQGGYDPTTNTPDIADGSALKGFFWAATAAGTFLGESVQVGDSIVAKVDNAGATIADWLILQGNIVIATDSVDGISRLATQTEANDGTEGGAVVITPATLQGKIDAQITPEISSKLPLSGGSMTGHISMTSHNIYDANSITANTTASGSIFTNSLSDIDAGSISFISNLNGGNLQTIINLPAPTNGGDAANKTYVDGAASTAQANAEAYADSLAPNYDAAGSASQALTDANAYSDSLAPNYDPAGSAATAESNANAYTDTRVDALNYSTFIQVNDWVLDEVNGGYYYIATHNLNTYSAISGFLFSNSGEYLEFASEMISENEIKVKSNIIPVSQQFPGGSITATFYNGRI